MADIFDKETRSALMARIQGRNTRPEVRLRRMLFAMGYRFRLHAADLPGRPDVVFTKRKAAIFMHGCFWHGHTCPAGRIPRTRREFWERKLAANRERDARQVRVLEEAGWRVLVIWECELRKPEGMPQRLASFLGPVRM